MVTFNKKGFTLLEMLVAVSVFGIVMVLGSGSISSIFKGFSKARTSSVSINNAGLAIEEMSRALQNGYKYHCGIEVGAIDVERDCGYDAATAPPPPPPPPPPNYPISHWKFDGNADDMMGVNNGTLVNGPIFVASLFGQAVDLDGFNEYVNSNFTPNFAPTDSISISMFVKLPNSGKVGQRFIGSINGNGANNEALIQIRQSSTDTFQASIRDTGGAGPTESIVSNVFALDNAWHHIVYVFNADTARHALYIDGQFEIDGPITGLSDGPKDFSSGPWAIGARRDNPTTYVLHTLGQIDEVGVYRRALSLAEIQSLYSTGDSPGSTSPTPPPSSTALYSIAFENLNGDPNDLSDQIIYRHATTTAGDGWIEKSINGGASYERITPVEVDIDNLLFHVRGSGSTDLRQARVLIIVQGSTLGKNDVRTNFNLQTTVTQRVADN